MTRRFKVMVYYQIIDNETGHGVDTIPAEINCTREARKAAFKLARQLERTEGNWQSKKGGKK